MSSSLCAVLPPPPHSVHPVDVGTRSEGAVIRELSRRGYSVSVPVGSNQRYDLIVDVGELLRVQCKTGRLRDGAIRFSTRSTRVNTHGSFRRRYVGEVEFFAIYCPDTDGVYFVPIEEAGGSEGCLRVEPPRNRQERGIRWASRYELPPVGPAADADLHSADPPA